MLDNVATDVAASFYRTLSSGQSSVDRTLVLARQAVGKACEQRGDPSWSLPVLYAGSQQSKVFDPTRKEPSSRSSLVLRAVVTGLNRGRFRYAQGSSRQLPYRSRCRDVARGIRVKRRAGPSSAINRRCAREKFGQS